MIIAGLQKLSLVDYPGKLAAVVFLQGCNFRCGYCQNPGLIGPGKGRGMSEEEVFNYLTARKGKIEAVVVTGGEPTVQSDLPGLLERLAVTGLKVKLDTNGSNPGVIKDLILGHLVDYIAIDIKTSFSKYSSVSSVPGVAGNVAESVRACLSSKIPHEFRTTCVPGILERDDFHDIGRQVEGAERYYLQQFRPEITYDPGYGTRRPFDLDEARSFAEILKGYVNNVEIRGF